MSNDIINCTNLIRAESIGTGTGVVATDHEHVCYQAAHHKECDHERKTEGLDSVCVLLIHSAAQNESFRAGSG